MAVTALRAWQSKRHRPSQAATKEMVKAADEAAKIQSKSGTLEERGKMGSEMAANVYRAAGKGHVKHPSNKPKTTPRLQLRSAYESARKKQQHRQGSKIPRALRR
jgi:hypothetical protein